jgi:UDP-N-acetylglucosamine acyltransferase
MAPAQIHPQAMVDDSAQVADDVVIGPGVIVEADTVIGRGCHLYPRAFVGRYTELADGVQVHMGAVVGHVPQDLKYDESIRTACRIGERTVIREYATIHRATHADQPTDVGRDCFLMNYTHIGHDCRLGNNIIMANGAMLAGHVEVEDQAYLGPDSLIHQFCRIGRLVMLSAQATVSQDVPPFQLTEGRNAIRSLNLVGMQRAGLSAETRRAVRDAHGILYRQGLSQDDALAQIESQWPDLPEIQHFVRFCRASKRGVMRPRGRTGSDT